MESANALTPVNKDSVENGNVDTSGRNISSPHHQPPSPLQHLQYSSPQHTSHHDNTKEILEFEYNEENSLLEELQRLCLLEKPSKREERLNREGKWCAVTCQKLDVSDHISYLTI